MGLKRRTRRFSTGSRCARIRAIWHSGSGVHCPPRKPSFIDRMRYFLERDDEGKWRERFVKIRLPKIYMEGLTDDPVSLTTCYDSEFARSAEGGSSEHLEYTLHFAPSTTIPADWQGGAIHVRTQRGDITIPVRLLETARKVGPP